jgi:hypothetical protein
MKRKTPFRAAPNDLQIILGDAMGQSFPVPEITAASGFAKGRVTSSGVRKLCSVLETTPRARDGARLE